MINISSYEEDKKNWLVTLAKVGAAYAISKKKFDPESGKELAPEVIALDRNDLIVKKEQLNQDVKQIDLLLADLEDLG